MPARETPYRLEPCHLDVLAPDIADQVSEIARDSGLLGARLAPQTAASLADLVRTMNCYYSNLIEGHRTRPRDLARALSGELDAPGERRDLQLEAMAHIRVQRELDRRFDGPDGPEPASVDFVRWLHRSFYDGSPQRWLTVSGAHGDFTMVPGEFRDAVAQDVVVGRHLPPSGPYVAAFMKYFEATYRFERMGTAQKIVAIATAHHRFNFVHPFPDGNGRVSRLMSHAMALRAGIGAHGLWSISRGLARGLSDASQYKAMMDLADTPREGDLDGRGHLSRRALDAYVRWFLDVMLDQIRFMSGLFDLDGLSARFRRVLADDEGLVPEAFAIVDHLLLRGTMPRGAAPRVTGLRERAARDALAALSARGWVGSDSPKGEVSLRFPADGCDVLFPRLFLDAGA